MTNEIEAQFNKTPWILVRAGGEEIYCEFCGEAMKSVGSTADALIEFSKQHEACACDHSDMDEGVCMDCGEDRTEHLTAMAYDRWKDSRYDD